MRVLALSTDPGVPLDGTKGAAVHLLELWSALARAGVEVAGVAPARGAAGIPPRGPRLSIWPVAGERRDAGVVAAGVEAAAIAAGEAERPDAVLERLSRASDLGARLARRFDVPLAVEVNAPLDDEAARFRGQPPSEEASRAQARLLAAADLVICVSEELVPYVVARGARPERVLVLPNGVDVEAFARREYDSAADPAVESAAARPATPVRFGFAGSFKPWHGCDVILEAAARAAAHEPSITFDLLGEGPLLAPLVGRAWALGLGSRVRFLGAWPHARVPAFLRSLDVAIAAAPAGIDYYFSPLKLCEYAAAGCAIIAPHAGQVARRFRHGVDAWLVAPGAPAELAEAMVMLACDPALRRRLGEAAAARARAEFDWSHVARRLIEGLEAARQRRSAATAVAHTPGGATGGSRTGPGERSAP
ncbi:MAG TPA: glycosyltransferase family 4 protein [Candidatus Eisenbacteria bacterium]|jgi:glycosyltransferase involved in cell wall biosynthesis